MTKPKKKATPESIGTPVPGRWKKPGASGGILHGPSTLMMACYVGDATANDGEKFELLCQGWGPGAPLIRCQRTGLQFTLSWLEIVKAAIDAGITSEHPDMEGK